LDRAPNVLISLVPLHHFAAIAAAGGVDDGYFVVKRHLGAARFDPGQPLRRLVPSSTFPRSLITSGQKERRCRMSRLNLRARMARLLTHEGAPAARDLTIEQQLRRSVSSCLLWEREFYEDGEAIADRIAALAEKAAPTMVAALAVEARSNMHLRHAPLLLLTVLAKTGSGSRLVSETIERTVQRADELAEFLAIYWRNGKTPLSSQVKKGLAARF
jgi:hypothetical protein